jgi:hypothetical protein
MELTDSQVLSQLRMKRVRLKIELERVELAIKAFEEVAEVEPLDALPYLMEDGEYKGDEEDLAITKLMYNARMGREQKVMYVLSKIKQGDVNDIANYLMKIDSTIHPNERTAIHDRITWVASRMYKAKKIGAIKKGKKNIYKLLE